MLPGDLREPFTVGSKFQTNLIVEFEHSQESLLGDFDPANILHSLLALFLLVEQLVLSSDVATVELRSDFHRNRLDYLAGVVVVADSRWDRNVELLPWSRVPYSGHELLALRVGEVADAAYRQPIHAFAVGLWPRPESALRLWDGVWAWARLRSFATAMQSEEVVEAGGIEPPSASPRLQDLRA